MIYYVSAVLNGALRLDGLALRRTAGGRLMVSFPRRGNGRFAVFPIDQRSRREIERQVLAALDRELAR